MTAAEEPRVLLEDLGDDGILHLVLNRPDKRNALNGALVGALADALARSAQDPQVRLVLLSGAGGDFCSGADLAELARLTDLGVEAS